MADVGLLALAKEYTDKKLTEFIDVIYPIGSIYVSVNNVSPATLFGGTWVQIKDRFLLSAGDTYKAGDTGGAATIALTVNQMPRHRHASNAVRTASSDDGKVAMRSASLSQEHTNLSYTDYAGNGEAHDNMPPYLVVYVYKRTA